MAFSCVFLSFFADADFGDDRVSVFSLKSGVAGTHRTLCDAIRGTCHDGSSDTADRLKHRAEQALASRYDPEILKLGSASAVSEQSARCCAGALAVTESLHPVDKDVSVAVGVLDSPPFASGQVVNGFTDPLGLNGQLI